MIKYFIITIAAMYADDTNPIKLHTKIDTKLQYNIQNLYDVLLMNFHYDIYVTGFAKGSYTCKYKYLEISF